MNQIRVILVDDHLVMRRALSLYIAECTDFKVVAEASDGEAAVALARKLKPNVILMDYSMPKMNGLEATRIIHSELPQICIIGLSMYQESEIEAAMLKAGAADYFTKSGDIDHLMSILNGCGCMEEQELYND
ncbi:MAG: DNA-binding response regulator [Desulfobacteraceae bacterium]|nr:MAG: DNA-binding response regulator [Desulfobacteraceae bacterium]